MSTYTPADLTGRIFDNLDKRKRKQPDYSGTANINGQIFRIAAWRNPPSENSPRSNISLKFQDKHEFDLEQKRKREERAGKRGQKDTPAGEDFNDDIPF